MAPIKFDDNIKEKLEKRTLRPSAEAWEKLSHRLDAEEKVLGNKSSYYWWVGIAASVVGVVFMVSQLGNAGSVNTIEPEVVVTPETIEKTINDAIIDEPVKLVEERVPVVKENVQDYILKQPQERLQELDEVVYNVSQVAPIEITILPSEQESLVIDKKEERNLPKTFADQKIQDVVAQIKELEENSTEVTSAEVDALLLKAQQEITLNQLINKSTGVVDADLLLQDVEAEVDQSFRSKVFEALKQSYNSVKTAVAQRND